MQYLLTLYADEAGWSNMSKSEKEQGMAAYMAYGEALKAAGAWVGSNRLQPVSTATTVRNVNGKAQVLDGPYVDSKEQLGGYYLIDVPDLDAALSWAARCPDRRPWGGRGSPDLEHVRLQPGTKSATRYGLRNRPCTHAKARSRHAARRKQSPAAATASSSPFFPHAHMT